MGRWKTGRVEGRVGRWNFKKGVERRERERKGARVGGRESGMMVGGWRGGGGGGQENNYMHREIES